MPSSSTSGSSYIPRFPEEITEKILSYCDGKTLINAGLSDNICSDIVGKRIKWEATCKGELPPRLLDELLADVHPKHWFSPTDVNWYHLFESSMRWKNLKLGKTEKVCDSSVSITSIEVSGDVVFMASNKGVQAINLNSKRLSTIYEGIAIDKMDLFCSKNAPSSNRNLEGCLHDQLDLLLIPRFHVTINLHKKYHQSRAYHPEREHIITKYDKNATLHVTCHKNRTPELRLYIDGKLVQSAYEPKILDVTGVSLWNNTVSYFLSNWSLETRDYDLDVLVSGSQEDDLPKAIDCTCRCLSEVAFKLKYWKYGVFFAVSMCNRLYINVMNADAYCITVNRVVTAIELYQNILFLGSDVGYVYLYRIKDLDDLLRLSMEGYQLRIDVADCAIKGIKCCQTNGLPAIVVATPSSLYRIPLDDGRY